MDNIKPTLVIGIGNAGRRIVDDTERFVTAHLSDAAAEAFGYVVIDTDAGVTSETPEAAYPIQIDKPSDQEWHDDVESFHYLSEYMDGLGAGTTGVMRQRAVSRYHLDKQNNFARVRQQLREQIDDHMQKINQLTTVHISDPSALNIWLVNSLGGGTGSGAFPMIALMLADIRNSIEYRLYINGIGGTPELDVGPQRTRSTQTGSGLSHVEEHINTYTALRELAALIDHETDSRDSNYGQNGLMVKDAHGGPFFELRRPPFEEYFLLGHDPDKAERSSLRQINRVGGMLITFYALHGELDNFPDTTDIDDEHTLYAVDGAEIHVPVVPNGDWDQEYNLQTVISKQESINGFEERIRALEDEITDRKDAKRYLNYLLENPPRAVTPPDFADTDVDVELVRQVKNTADAVGHEDITNGVFGIEEETNRLVNQVGDLVRDARRQQYREEEVITYLYCGYLEVHLSQNVLPTHPFFEGVSEWLEYIADEEGTGISHDDGGPLYKYESAITAWNRKVEDYIEDLIEEYEQRAEQQGIIGGLLDDYELKKIEYENRLADLQQEKARYEEIQEVMRTARSKKENAKQQFDRRIQELSTKINEQQSTKADLKNQISSERNNIKRILQRLRETENRNERYVRVGLDSGEFNNSILTRSEETGNKASLSTEDSLVDLFKSGEMPVRHIARLLANKARQLENPPMQEEATGTQDIFCLGTREENIIAETDHNILHEPIAGQKSLVDTIDSRFTYFDEEKTVVGTDSGFTIFMLSLFTNLDLSATYEYSHLHGHFADEGRNVSETVLGEASNIDDTELASRFAYPELLDDEEQIRQLMKSES